VWQTSRERDVLVQSAQPMQARAFRPVPEFAEPHLGDNLMAHTEGDELPRGQLCMTRKWLENIVDVVADDLHALRHGAAVEMRAAFLIGNNFITWEL
jgi:hypothetical protein